MVGPALICAIRPLGSTVIAFCFQYASLHFILGQKEELPCHRISQEHVLAGSEQKGIRAIHRVLSTPEVFQSIPKSALLRRQGNK